MHPRRVPEADPGPPGRLKRRRVASGSSTAGGSSIRPTIRVA
jgi:hypothetical protein